MTMGEIWEWATNAGAFFSGAILGAIAMGLWCYRVMGELEQARDDALRAASAATQVARGAIKAVRAEIEERERAL